MSVAFRGTTVHFEAAFFDVNGNPASPASVELSVNYVENNERTNSTFAMSLDIFRQVWFYNWDSTGIQPGQVNWSVKSDPTHLPIYVDDGCFNLSANTANLEAE